MGMVKLALTAMVVCALLGASTRGYAESGATTAQLSGRGSTMQRLVNPAKSAPSRPAVSTALGGAKAKLAGITHGVRLGPSGSLKGAKSNWAAAGTVIAGGATVAAGLGLAAMGQVGAGIGAAIVGGLTVLVGGSMAAAGWPSSSAAIRSSSSSKPSGGCSHPCPRWGRNP